MRTPGRGPPSKRAGGRKKRHGEGEAARARSGRGRGQPYGGAKDGSTREEHEKPDAERGKRKHTEAGDQQAGRGGGGGGQANQWGWQKRNKEPTAAGENGGGREEEKHFMCSV